jgi:phage gp36-like protein
MPKRISRTMLENRLSAGMVRRIYDDNNDGTPDNDPIIQLLEDAEAKVDSYLAAVGLVPADGSPIPRDIQRLDLDVAVAMAAARHPEVLRSYNAEALMRMAEKDLERLRKGVTKTGATPPDPAANQGGAVYPGPSAKTTSTGVVTSSFWEDMGDF